MKRRRYTHDPAPINSESLANQQPIDAQLPPEKKRTPRPREQKVISALVSGESKTLSNALITAGFHPCSTTLRDRFAPGGDLRQELDKQLETAGLTVPFALQKLRAKMDATKTLTVAGDALTTDDNDAQLRATDMTIKLLDRAGRLPGEPDKAVSSTTLNVNILVMP